jgi:hypothetical protein
MAIYLGGARTGHLDHHLSATLEKIASFSFEMGFKKGQSAGFIFIQEDAHQLE